MKFWEKFRLPFLVIVAGGTGCALIWGMTFPKLIERQTVASYVFPKQVPLSGWQQVGNSKLSSIYKSTPTPSQSYQYRQSNWILNIKMHYQAVGASDMNQWLRTYTFLPLSSRVYHQEGVGYYSLLNHQQNLYLSSCINPKGNSTVTKNQYFKNKLLTEVRLSRFFSWLLGQKTFFDQRCLWTHMILLLSDSSNPEEAHRILRATWISWHSWWQSNFPQS